MRLVTTRIGLASDPTDRANAPEVYLQQDAIFCTLPRKSVPWGYLLEQKSGPLKGLKRRLFRASEGYITSLLGRWALYTMDGAAEAGVEK